jgi:hypothetical protein
MAIETALPAQIEDQVLMYLLALRFRGGMISPATRQASWLARRLLHLDAGSYGYMLKNPPEPRLEAAGFDAKTVRIVDHDKFDTWLKASRDDGK